VERGHDQSRATARPAAEPLSARVSRACARICASKAFDMTIFAVIVINAVVLGLETYRGLEEDVGGLLGTLNDVFLAVFVGELAIRIAAYGSRPQDFFKGGWNVFDFVVIAAAFVPGLRENSTLLRLVRLARVVRVVRILPDLRLLVVAVGRSLPGVASLSVMGLLLLYVYGMIGWLVFEDHYPDDYGTIGEAMLTLFVLLSLENLPTVIEQGLEVSTWTVLYYVSFVLVAAFLLLNILIGVVINSMEEAREIEWQRAQEERRRHAAETHDPEDDRQVAIEQRLHDLRAALDDLERELHAAQRARG
jgi:voltage-gated sodium channel